MSATVVVKNSPWNRVGCAGQGNGANGARGAYGCPVMGSLRSSVFCSVLTVFQIWFWTIAPMLQ